LILFCTVYLLLNKIKNDLIFIDHPDDSINSELMTSKDHVLLADRQRTKSEGDAIPDTPDIAINFSKSKG
jgi:hypothetical protein